MSRPFDRFALGALRGASINDRDALRLVSQQLADAN
jgi:hypothetical protein